MIKRSSLPEICTNKLSQSSIIFKNDIKKSKIYHNSSIQEDIKTNQLIENAESSGILTKHQSPNSILSSQV